MSCIVQASVGKAWMDRNVFRYYEVSKPIKLYDLIERWYGIDILEDHAVYPVCKISIHSANIKLSG